MVKDAAVLCSAKHASYGGHTHSSHIVRNFGMRNSLQPDHPTVETTGSAGQALGAFAAPGLKIEVSGDANDYVGGVLWRYHFGPSDGQPIGCSGKHNHWEHGSYGATDGYLFAAGRAGERFAVRNSAPKLSLKAVVQTGVNI